MALILAASINLNEIPKDKIIVGKKGKYLPFLPMMILSLGISFRLMLAANINAIILLFEINY